MKKLAKRLTAIIIPAALAVSAVFLYGCNSHTHTVEFVAGTPSTCSEQGTVDHWHCIECEKNFREPSAKTELSTITRPTLAHSFIGGYSFNDEQHYRVCVNCGFIDTYSMQDHILTYEGDDGVHYQTCYCGYEGTHSPHDPADGSSPCNICGYGGMSFILSDNTEYYICNGVSDSYRASVEEIVIPDTYLDKPVKEIGERAFQHCTALKRVVLGANVISIGNYAFMDCGSLTDVVFNSKLKEIQTSAFNDCVSLEQIKLPNGLTSLGNGVFHSCTGLKVVEIPSSIKTIERQTFYNCCSLDTIVLPRTLRSIETAAFSGTALTSIVLPSGLTELPMTLFLSCSKLVSVTLPSTIKKINGAAFSGCISLKEINFYGTEAQWSEVELSDYPQAWDYGTPEYVVNCLG